MMELKHKDLIHAFSKCEIINCTARNREAFRWVFENINDERNFIPRYFSPVYSKIEKTDCIGYALSMFDTEAQATNRLALLSKGKKNLYKKLGTHTAKGVLTMLDGLSNDSSAATDHSGHFSFFEFINTDLSKIFILCKQKKTNS